MEENKVVTTEVSTAPAKKAFSKSYKDYNAAKDFDNALQRYKIIYPGLGDTGHHMMIRSIHSHVFREAQLKSQRQISALVIANAGKEDPDFDSIVQDIQMRAFASIVASWSFDEECNVENVAEFLTANSFAYDDINILACQDSLFLTKKENG